jgi:hypothetical protein
VQDVVNIARVVESLPDGFAVILADPRAGGVQLAIVVADLFSRA